MRYLKIFGLATLAAALMALFAAGAASATTIETVKGAPLGTGTTFTGEASTTELHLTFGSINCKKSHFGGKTTNTGGIVEGKTVGVKGTVESLSLIECGGTITPVPIGGDYGTFEIVSNGNGRDGVLYGTGQEVTLQYLGFHCVFKTNHTKYGAVTGSETTSSNARLDIEATLPRTGGTSGAFCGQFAQWTGSFKFTAPNPLYVT